jgi:hypothetical protein
MNRFYTRMSFVLILGTVSLSLRAFSFFSGFSNGVAYDPFNAVVGIGEQQFFNEYGFSEAGKEFLKQKLQGQQGKFYLKQVERFDSKLLLLWKERELLIVDPVRVKFSIIEGGENPSGTSFQKYLDVTALQALPENNGAVFQVASNLSCLESTGTKQERISRYYLSRAQGQLCALSALPGTIDRMYVQPSINLLKNFYWRGPVSYTEGYFPYLPDMDSRFKDMSYEDILQASSTLCVGVQKNVCVTSGSRDYKTRGFKAVPVRLPNQSITQVFTAALDPYNNRMLTHTIGFKNLASILLHGAYKGTFDVAREVGAKKLFLTLVGGGVFQNKYHWIAEAIRAACFDFPENNYHEPLEVTLVLYHISPNDKQEDDWKNAEGILKELVSQTGGTWTRYTSSGAKKVL